MDPFNLQRIQFSRDPMLKGFDFERLQFGRDSILKGIVLKEFNFEGIQLWMDSIWRELFLEEFNFRGIQFWKDSIWKDSSWMDIRAGAILIFVFDLPNHLTIAVGTQGEVTYKISAF